MGSHLRRRDAIRAGLSALAAPIGLAMAPPPAREVRAFRLIERDGLRRFGYPVYAIVPDASGGRNYRLVRDGRAIPAQFREFEGPDGQPQVALDFVASPAPMESPRYEVQFGMEVEPGPEPNGGLTLEERAGRTIVTQGGTMGFEIDPDPARFLRAVGSPRLGYLRDDPSRVKIRSKGDAESREPEKRGQPSSRVTRHGPIAVGLRLTCPAGPAGTLAVDLTIPNSKTWVQAVITLDDPQGSVAGLEFELGLLIEGSPTLVDFGAGSTVYGQIKGGEHMEMAAGLPGPGPGISSIPGWRITQGPLEKKTTLAASTSENPRIAEGWAHAMDARRCTAIAIADFGRERGVDRIDVGADGRVRLVRDFGSTDAEPPRGPKSLAFWLHFVPMPVQVGALTSPQSMLAPPRVEWDRVSRGAP